ncbi:MAG: PAS domain S-box protein [Magnetococcales bacterium]|nr:PAS domain S-box protein [Magnetococcales bacterium]
MNNPTAKLAGQNQPLILVVEDDEDLMDLIIIFLQNLDYQTAQATNGREAVAFCKKSPPSMIIMDIAMPIMDGVTACAEIHKQAGEDKIPIIMITALNSTKDVDRSFAAGANDFITKPIHFAVLKNRILRTLERITLEKSLKSTNKRMEAQVLERTQQLQQANEDLNVHQHELMIKHRELVQSHKNLEQARDRWAILFNDSPLGLILLSQEGTILEPNSKARSMLGIELTGFSNLPFTQFFTQESQDALLPHLKDLFHKKMPQSCKVTALINGNPGPILQMTSTFLMEEKDMPTLFLVTMTDITQRILAETSLKTANLALEKQRLFLETVLENIQDGIVACDKRGMLTYFNRATRFFHGIDQENLPPKEWAERYDLYLPDGVTHMPTSEVPLFKAFNGKKIRSQEMVIAPKNGKKRFIEATGQPMYDDTGDKLGAMISLHDVTEQKKAQADLLESEGRYHALFEQTAESVVLVDVDTMTIVECNRKAYEILGYEREEFIGLSLKDIDLAVQQSDKEIPRRKRLIQENGELIIESQHQCRNGIIHDVAIKSRPLTINSRPSILCVWRDITLEKKEQESRKRFQEEVENNERKRLAHTLHDTVVQDLHVTLLGLKRERKNILSGTQTSTEFLNQSIDGVTNTIQQLRNISSTIHPLFLEKMDLEEAMQWKCGQLNMTCKITNQWRDMPEWWQMSKTIKNNTFLIFQEALTNAVKHTDVDEINVGLHIVDSSLHKMEIFDHGQGMDQSQLLESPTGLGIAIMQERAQRINGELQIKSTPGKGTIITLLFPISSTSEIIKIV